MLRFHRLAIASLAVLIFRFHDFLRLAWPCVAVSLVAGSVSAPYAWAGGIVELLARGLFVATWVRLVHDGLAPAGTVRLRLGRRDAAAAVVWMVAETFVTLPGRFIGTAAAVITQTPVADTLMVTVAVSHLLLGGAYLVVADVVLAGGPWARSRAAEGTWCLPDMVVRGGFAVGVTMVLAWLPGTLLGATLRQLPAVELLEGLTLEHAAQVVGGIIGLAVIAGTMAMLWNALAKETQGA